MLTNERKEGLTILANFIRTLTLGLISDTEIEGLYITKASGTISYMHLGKYLITLTTNISKEVQKDVSTIYCFMNNDNIMINQECYDRNPVEDFFALSTVLDKLYFERLYVMSLLHDVKLPSPEYCIVVDDFNVSTFLFTIQSS